MKQNSNNFNKLETVSAGVTAVTVKGASTSTSTTTRTQRQACSDPLIELQIQGLTVPYMEVFGGSGIPAPICGYFARLIRAGMEPDVIASAINATAWARVPTPYYMRAILQRYLAEGILTEQQLNHDIIEMEGRRREQGEAIEERMYE